MINGELVNVTDFGNTKDASSTYVNWAEGCGINTEDFSFKLKTGRMHKGKEIIFTIRSWGFYEASKGTYVLYVAYYFAPMKHLVQYSWNTGEFGQATGDARKDSWVGG